MVIHDFQHKRCGNIDHIVIGRQGVFALETKYRTQLDSNSRLFYDGENVYTLDYSNNKTLIANDNGKTPCSQAAHSATELKKLLEIDFPRVKRVQPIVIFPYWDIMLKQYDIQPNVRVSNEKDIYKQLVGRDDYFSDKEVAAVYDYLAIRNK